MSYVVAGLLLLFLLLRLYLVIITVHGRSMEPTLFAGDRVLLLRLRLRRLLQPGQLVVCHYAPDISTKISPGNKQVASSAISGKPARYVQATTRQTYYIKRLWALGGDRVVLPAQAAPAHRERQAGDRPEQDDAGNFVWQIPPGHCFVKGDHTAYSYDSTSWGPIPLDYIVGIVLLKLPRRAESIDPAGGSLSASVEQPERQ
jgi:signal peptidase I